MDRRVSAHVNACVPLPSFQLPQPRRTAIPIAVQALNAGRQTVRCQAAIERRDCVTGTQQLEHDMTSDELSAAENESAHGVQGGRVERRL